MPRRQRRRGSVVTYEVYVHVPFCIRRCGYCDFNTYTARDMGGGASRGNYASMVVDQMRLVRRWQREHGIDEPPASSVFFGGGTPTVLAAADLGRMVDAVRDLWGLADDAEITTEANPDTVDARYIDTLAAAGFTRISFGMQSAVPHVLRTLDRTHTPANVEVGVREAETAGLRSSVDLIYGAPGESLDDWRTSVETALALGVHHVSAYALTVEPTTKMGRQIAAGLLPKPDDDDEAAKYEIADDLFTAAGLAWYEVSNWARPGHESRHNRGYWRNVDWAGIGPGAHSHYNAPVGGVNGIVDGDIGDGDGIDGDGIDNSDVGGEARDGVPAASATAALCHGLRSWDLKHPRLWGLAIREGRVPWEGSERIGPQEHLEELIMLGLRLREGLDLDRINRAIGEGGAGTANLRRIDPADLRGMVAEGLIMLDGMRVVPTRRGRLLNDALIARVFDLVGV